MQEPLRHGRPPVPLTPGTHTFEARGIGGTGTPGPSTTRSFVVAR